MHPHTPEAGCACRKPHPGLLLQAAAALHLDLARCWLVGDAPADIGAAEAAGVRWLLVRTGRGAETEQEHPQWPRDRICADLMAAVLRIGACPVGT